ncbi:MAG TPA: hypothetical protein VFO67_01670 [Gemmatimonadales bacterium]|nr:hypothetical protein [Gemmatimonadales bacterium]
MDDTTLGGYQQVHGRPPAFGATDGQAYSVATFTDDSTGGAQSRYGAALLFVRWGETGQPVGHLETDYLAFGATPDEALAPVLALTLEQVKAHLDDCVARQRV